MPLPLPIQADTFRAACAQFATGVAIATVRAADGTLHGLTVSSFTPVSAEPPLILICVDSSCSVLPVFRQSPKFAINILADSQQELSVAFSAKPEARFEGVEWTTGDSGLPLFPAALAQFECAADRFIEAGDHAILLGRVEAVTVNRGNPLLYFNRSYRSLM